jgi:hypothetical protein
MRKTYILIFISIQFCYSQKTKLIVNENIKKNVLENIRIDRNPSQLGIGNIYESKRYVKQIVEDTISSDFMEKPYFSSFSSNHYYKKDTLIISGGFGGYYKGFGFIAKVLPNRDVIIQQRLYWHGLASYYNTANEITPNSKILVKTTNTKLTINRLPNNKEDHIYGLIEFVSDDYYIKVDNEKTKIPFKEKNKSYYKVYFESRLHNDENEF